MTVPAKTYVLAEILDYVGTHSTEEGAFGISQKELSQALGYHPCSMSRPLDQLVKGGRLTERRGLVRGGIRKQLVYQLTTEGRSQLRQETRNVPMIPSDLPMPPRPFLGRREELRELAEHSKELDTVVWIEGAPGMGKTALVAQHVRRLRHGRIPCWFAVRPGSSPRSLVEAMAHALSSVGPSQLAYYAQTPRSPLGREVASLVLRALGEQTLLLVIDDAHVAGKDLQTFVAEFLIAIRSEEKVLAFVVSQEGPYLPSERIPVHRVVLGGLDRVSAHELTDRQGGLADRFETVFQSSLGSPLILQLALVNPDVEATFSSLPDALVSKMNGQEVASLLPVALANEPLPQTFLTEDAGMEPARVAQLTQSGILHPALAGRVEVLETIRRAMIARGRPHELEAHRTLASFYARSHRVEAVRERFLHLVAGEDWRTASEMIARDERKLLALGYSDALRNALNHMALAMPAGSNRVRALKLQSWLLRTHSEYSEAILLLRRAIGDAQEDYKSVTECLLLIVELFVRLRQLDNAASTLAQARGMGEPTRRLSTFIQLSEARIAEANGDLVTARLMFRETFDLARRARSDDLAVEALADWTRVATAGGSQDEVLRIVEEGLPRARDSGRTDLVFNLLIARARAYQETGKADLAELELRKIRAETEALGHLSQLTYTLSGLAAMMMESQRWDEAVDFARQASDLAERLSNELVLGHTLSVLAAGELRQGKVGDALEHSERGVQVLSRLPPSDSLVLARSYLSEVYITLGRATPARQEYSLARSLAESMGMEWWVKLLAAELLPKIERLESGPAETVPDLPGVSNGSTA